MKWTPEYDDVLREVIPGHGQKESVALFEERTGIALTVDQLSNRRHVLGLRHGVKTQPRKKWTPEREAYFREIVPGHSEREISALFEERFGEPLTSSQIGNAKARFGVKSGTVGGRFEKDHDRSWNKGLPRSEWGCSPEAIAAMERGQFKPGHITVRPGWVKPVGYERVSKDGYIEVKVHDGLQKKPNKNYRPKHHVIWEETHGPIPEGCNVVFADGDKRNFSPENLVLVSRRDWAPIKKRKAEFQDAETLEAQVNIVRLSRAIRRAEMEEKWKN